MRARGSSEALLLTLAEGGGGGKADAGSEVARVGIQSFLLFRGNGPEGGWWARGRMDALRLIWADGRGRKAKAARCVRALIRRFAPPSPASQEKGWDCWTFRCECKTGLATEPRS